MSSAVEEIKETTHDAGAEEGATVAVTKSKGKKKLLRRPRGKRGGVKHQKHPKTKSSTSEEKSASKDISTKSTSTTSASTPSPHSLLIASFHALEKKLAQATDEVERKKLLQERDDLGGLKAYQDASLLGADKVKGGESGKWIVQTLKEVRGNKREDIRLLDVGSLSGTSYVKYPWIKPTCIDINPRGPQVQQVDFFDLPVPASEEEKFDIVSLSMVINFLGDIQERGRMLIHAHRYLKKGGHLALILPLACVNNSRYCTHERLQDILKSCGWKVAHQDE
jgi:25S rRNA (adenine2142-N1)-methyltransferase